MPGVGAPDTPPSSVLLPELHLSPGSQLCLLPHSPGTLRGSPLPGLGAGGRRPPAAMTLCSSKSLSKHLGSPPPAQTSSPRPKHLPRLPCSAGPSMGPRATWPRRGLSPIWQSPPPQGSGQVTGSQRDLYKGKQLWGPLAVTGGVGAGAQRRLRAARSVEQ